jgi:hypothetical protein
MIFFRMLCSSAPLLLSALHELANWLAAGKHGKGPAGRVRVLGLRVDAQVSVHRGQHVLRRLGAGFGKRAVSIGLAHDAATP